MYALVIGEFGGETLFVAVEDKRCQFTAQTFNVAGARNDLNFTALP